MILLNSENRGKKHPEVYSPQQHKGERNCDSIAKIISSIGIPTLDTLDELKIVKYQAKIAQLQQQLDRAASKKGETKIRDNLEKKKKALSATIIRDSHLAYFLFYPNGSRAKILENPTLFQSFLLILKTTPIKVDLLGVEF